MERGLEKEGETERDAKERKKSVKGERERKREV